MLKNFFFNPEFESGLEWSGMSLHTSAALQTSNLRDL